MPVLTYEGTAVSRLWLDFGRDQSVYTPEGIRQERMWDIQADPGKAHLTRPRAFCGNGASAPDVEAHGNCVKLHWDAYDKFPETTALVMFPAGTAIAYEL